MNISPRKGLGHHVEPEGVDILHEGGADGDTVDMTIWSETGKNNCEQSRELTGKLF